MARPVMAPMMPGVLVSSSFWMSPMLWMPPDAITGRAIYEGTLDFAAAQARADELSGTSE